VQPELGQSPTDEELIAFVRTRIASYKAPRELLFVPSIERLVTGKNDYQRWKAFVTDALS
jgi:acyl-CoA synthetase (AMP-forming)/AMP-acid ligase II